MTNTYDKGDEVRCTGTFTDANESAVDPDAVTFKVRDPSGNITSYIYGTDSELVKSATGIYYVDVDVDESGYWRYRFESTGSGQAAGENEFNVKTSGF